jgi:succinoglycan biosynthesis transport protein ExoP
MPERPLDALIKKQDAPVSHEVAVARRVTSPRPVMHDSSGPNVSRNDILFALFKHKKKILFGAVAGLVAAAVAYLVCPVSYESDAKLMVRYLVERSTVDSVDTPKNPGGYAPTTDSIIGSEIEILSSWDLAVETAQAIGPQRFGTTSKEAAAAAIAGGLSFTTHKESNIIFASYQNANAGLAKAVLKELVNRYFDKHLEVHRSAGAFDFVAQQTDQVRGRLHQTEDALKDLREKAGIVSLGDATTGLETETSKVQEQLHLAEAELAEQQAVVTQLGGVIISGDDAKPQAAAPDSAAGGHDESAEGTKSEKSAPGVTPVVNAPPQVVQKYQVLASGLQKLRQTQLELFTKYRPESKMVKANQAEIDDVDGQLRTLEKKYPDLPSKVGLMNASKAKELDPTTEAAHLAGFRAKRNALAARLRETQQRAQQLSQLAPQLADLERQKQLEESNYKYFEASLEKARIDEALDPSKIPNISVVQQPSPPTRSTKTRNKIMLGAAIGGFALAVALALLNELLLSTKLRRPIEIEKFLGVNPLMSIPYSSKPKKRVSAFKRNGKVTAIVPKSGSRTNLAPWDAGHFVRPYTEAIRDRLGLYFELHNLTHKPKMVGVAGFSRAGGTSTLAAGLAAALSETNDGKVLLVDVSLGPDQVHPFFKGKPAYALNTALRPNGAMDAAAENLYLAKVGSPNAGPAQLGLKRFFDLIPNLKASDFDYIIFDMPPLEQTSPTWGMAPFMDKMLLIIEAEKDSRDSVKRRSKKLIAERDNISFVLNKVRSYAPKKFELDV